MKISNVYKDGVASEIGVAIGDQLIGFDGNTECDFLDYQYYNSKENFLMTVVHEDSITEYEIEKYSNEDLGLEFEDEIVVKRCQNKCIFCFIDQLPKENGKIKNTVRRTLLVKDDDYRLSTACGTFVTLTNLTDKDLKRIKDYKLSPMFVSVHSTDDNVRRVLLGNKKADAILPIIKSLHDSAITIHCQIVYCPTYNDDYVKTVLDLSEYCMSVAIVPLGVTDDYNRNLVRVTKDTATKVIKDIENLQQEFLKKGRGRFCYVADEMYVLANKKLPDADTYEDFYQIANGVGLIAQFDSEIKEALNNINKNSIKASKNYTIVTGVAATPYFSELIKRLKEHNINVKLKTVVNHYFGESITVAGLVTGSDIVKAFEMDTLDSNDNLLIPINMLKQFEDVFLDNMSLQELKHKLGVDITVVPIDGHALIELIIA